MRKEIITKIWDDNDKEIHIGDKVNIFTDNNGYYGVNVKSIKSFLLSVWIEGVGRSINYDSIKHIEIIK